MIKCILQLVKYEVCYISSLTFFVPPPSFCLHLHSLPPSSTHVSSTIEEENHYWEAYGAYNLPAVEISL